jgi:hypothetical protein
MTTAPEELYLRALLPDPVVVLGQRLDCYSIGSELLLLRFKNAFVSGRISELSGEELVGQLFTATFVISNKFEDARRMLVSSDLPAVFREWRQNLARRNKAGCDPLEEALRLKAFILREQKWPGTSPVQRKGSKGLSFRPGATIDATLLNHLQANCGLGMTAFDVGYALAKWMYLVYWEERGTVRIHSNEEVKEASAAREWMLNHGYRPLNRRDLSL